MKFTRYHAYALNTILLASATRSTHADSSSFLMPRSLTHNATLELALNNYHIYHDQADNCAVFSIYATPFYMQSNNPKNLSRYLLPNNANCLNIQENGTGNIGSLWLDLVAVPGQSFSSLVTIAPKRTVVGSYFYTRLDKRSECWWFQDLWFSVSFAALQAKHRINGQEQLTGDKVYGTVPGITTGLEALNNPAWMFGKVSPCTLTKSGVDDVQLKLGNNWFFCNDQSHIGLYLVGSAPTGNRPNAVFLFEPLIGTQHGAFGIGTNADFTAYLDENSQCNIMYDIKYRYLFSGCETRSFDLCTNGDWSRYLLVVNQAFTSVSLPGINACTVPVRVTPASQIEAWLAVHYEWCNMNVEVGYNLWWRSTDKNICTLQSFPANTGIYDLAGAVAHNPISASRANITQSAIGPNKAPSDSIFTPSSNFYLKSGSQLRALTNSIYLAFSYNDLTDNEHAWLIGIGGGYEFAQGNTALAQWSVWGKIGLRI